MDCPCEGKYSRPWHLKRGLPMCEHVKEERRLEDLKRRHVSKPNFNPVVPDRPARWRAGTSIYIPDYEPP